LPVAALFTACAVAAAMLAGSGEPRAVRATPQPAATTSVSLPAATPKPKPRAPAPAPRAAPPPRYTVVRASYERPVYAPARPGAHTALIIGINDNDPTNPLHGAHADATNMRNALLKYGFHASDVTVLIDGQATRARILDELRRLVARTPSNGVAVFAAASHGAGSSFRTADGARLYASDLGRYLGRIRAPVWTALAMCYAAGFAVPGVVGANRVATFSSAANQLTYEMGGAGSELFYTMIKQGMVDGYAPRSVESAFNYAHSKLGKNYSNLPVMRDGVPGELVLGPVNWGPPAPAAPPVVAAAPPVVDSPATPEPEPTPPPDNGGLAGILCGLLGCRRH